MKEMSIRQIRAALPQIDDLLKDEGEVVITRRGRPIARMLPLQPQRPTSGIPSRAALRATMPRQTSSVDLIRQDRDGRG